MVLNFLDIPGLVLSISIYSLSLHVTLLSMFMNKDLDQLCAILLQMECRVIIVHECHGKI